MEVCIQWVGQRYEMKFGGAVMKCDHAGRIPKCHSFQWGEKKKKKERTRQWMHPPKSCIQAHYSGAGWYGKEDVCVCVHVCEISQ